MGDRKEINKYISPDFDASKLPRAKVDRDAPQPIRLMLPFGLKCEACGNTMAKQLKVNATKETAKGMDYLGVRRFRFKFKCSRCRGRITFLTDPENADYEMETGGKRSYDFTLERKRAEMAAKREKEREEQEGGESAEASMRKLEDRTLNSKKEMETMEALEDLRAQNRKRERVDDPLSVIEKAQAKDAVEPSPEVLAAEAAADEAAAREVFAAKRSKLRRLEREDSSETPAGAGPKPSDGGLLVAQGVKSRKKKTKKTKNSKKGQSAPLPAQTGLMAYASSSSEDED